MLPGAALTHSGRNKPTKIWMPPTPSESSTQVCVLGGGGGAEGSKSKNSSRDYFVSQNDCFTGG